MPVDNAVFDERGDILSLYWTTQDVLAFLAEPADDAHLLRIKASAERQSRDGVDRKYGDAVSLQHQTSAKRNPLHFEGLRTTATGHKIQDIKQLMPIPVIVTSDMTKSPPVLVMYACELDFYPQSLSLTDQHAQVIRMRNDSAIF